MNKWFFLSALTVLAAVIYFGCGDEIVNSDRSVIFPDSNVSYQNHVQLFLNLKCAYKYCHSSEDKADGRDMSNYFGLWETANAGLVIAGEPEVSRLVQILRSNPAHRGNIEFPAGYFSDNNINGIVTWIKEGARFN